MQNILEKMSSIFFFFLNGKYNFVYTEHQLFFLPERSNAVCELVK